MASGADVTLPVKFAKFTRDMKTESGYRTVLTDGGGGGGAVAGEPHISFPKVARNGPARFKAIPFCDL